MLIHFGIRGLKRGVSSLNIGLNSLALPLDANVEMPLLLVYSIGFGWLAPLPDGVRLDCKVLSEHSLTWFKGS